MILGSIPKAPAEDRFTPAAPRCRPCLRRTELGTQAPVGKPQAPRWCEEQAGDGRSGVTAESQIARSGRLELVEHLEAAPNRGCPHLSPLRDRQFRGAG